MIGVAIAPYDDQPGEDHRGGSHTAKPKAPKAADAVPKRMCPACGMLVPPCDGGRHATLWECIDSLRTFIAMEKWNAPIKTRVFRGGRPKKRAAAAH